MHNLKRAPTLPVKGRVTEYVAPDSQLNTKAEVTYAALRLVKNSPMRSSARRMFSVELA
jgi:hypothetical protein